MVGHESLSAAEARRIAIRAQGLSGPRARRDVQTVLRHLGAVQLDTISVLARSHELVAYSRLGAIGRPAVEHAFWGAGHAFEYMAHANCILPIELWPYFAFRRREARAHNARLRPLEGGWDGASDFRRAVTEVRARLRDGPITSTEVGGAKNAGGAWWDWSATKVALEILYRQGEVICATRRRWQRVYDLPERILQPALLHHEPSDAECIAALVAIAARALGVATRKDIADYFRFKAGLQAVRPLFNSAFEAAALVPVRVEGWDEGGWAHPSAFEAPLPRRAAASLLSPFDSLVWYRQRAARLFGFEFRLEAYTPKALRERGYFTMPLLAGDTIAGFVDPAREGKTLVARRAHIESAAAIPALAEALRQAAAWVGCEAVRVERVTPDGLTGEVRAAVEDG